MTTENIPTDDFLLGLKEGGMTQQEIADQFDITVGKVAGRIKRHRDHLQKHGLSYPQEIDYPSSVELHEDGTQTSDRLVLICEEERKDPRRLLELHNYDPDKWVIVHSVDNLWHMSKGWKLGGGVQIHYQSKITVKPNNDFTLETVQKWFETYNGGARSKVHKPKQYCNNGDVLEVFISDMHKGNRPFIQAKDIEEKFEETVMDIVGRCKGKKFSKIILVLGGDNFHFDTKDRTTTSGTQMTTNGQTLPEIYNDLLSTVTCAVETISKIAPVEMIHIPGNHDWFASFALAQAVKLYFRNNENVTVDADQLPRKWRMFGKSLVGFAHGDMSKKLATGWLMVEAREEWGLAKFAEVHMAHWHSQEQREENGLVCRWFPTMTGEDEWHYNKGYVGSVKATVCCVWGLEYGLKEMWYINC